MFINELQHKLSGLANAGPNIPVGLDIGTTRSTVALFDARSSSPEVVTIRGAGAVSGVTYMPSEFLHLDGDGYFETGMT